MAFIGTTDGALVVTTYYETTTEQSWSNSLWFSKADFEADDLQDLADMVKVTLVDHLVDLFRIGVSLSEVKAIDMRTVDGVVRYGAGGGGTGDVDSELMPVSVAMVLTLRTDKRGRAHRGRLYLSGWTEADMVDGAFIAGRLASVENAFTELQTDVAAIGWTWGVHSSRLDGVARNPQVITPITSFDVRSQLPGSQRGRVHRS